MTKLRTFACFAVLLALATAFVACGDSSNSDKSADAVLDEATFEGVDSGDIDLAIEIAASGAEGGNVDVTLSGPFAREGEEELPRLDLVAEASGRMDGEDVEFDAGVVLVPPDRAYIGYEGVDYEVDPTTFSFVQSTLEETQQREGGGEDTGLTACQEAAAKLDVGSFAENAVNEGSVDVAGVSTTKVSGDLDVSGAIEALVELSEDPACKAQLGAGDSLPSEEELDEAKSEVEDALKRAHVEVYVGDDDIVRRVVAQLGIEPKGSGSGPKSIEVDFDLTLSGVNEEQSVVVPKKTRPLSALFIKLGVNPIELIGLISGEDGGSLGLDDLLGGLGGDSGSGGGQTYTECLQDASSAADIQKCGAKLR